MNPKIEKQGMDLNLNLNLNLNSDDCGRRKVCSRGHWRPTEDFKLKELVRLHGPHNWNIIAHNLPGRSGKSCRLRWFNQLDPRINKKAFTEEEEERLIAAHRVYGNKWAIISKLFNGRTDNSVKNHWHVIMARKFRRTKLILHHSSNSSISSSSTPPSTFHHRHTTGVVPSSSSSSSIDKIIALPGSNIHNKMVSEYPYYLWSPPQTSGNQVDPTISFLPPPFIDFLGVGAI